MIYIGARSANTINDGYMGSGKRIKAVIKKYGVNNFSKVVLFEFTTRKELLQKEAEVVNEEFVLRNDTYNIVIGGGGGSTSKTNGMLGKHQTTKHREASQQYMTNNKEKYQTNEYRAYMSRRLKEIGHNHATFRGRTHSEATLKQMSQSSKGQGIGANNSQYGTCWITNGEINKKIPKDTTIPDGWKLGRIIHTR